MTDLARFLGYDPGGNGTNAVAVAAIAASGEFDEAPETELLSDAAQVMDWLCAKMEDTPRPVALGLDTLLGWSLYGRRACDVALRRKYPAMGPTVISQNSLYSAMTLNGMMIAQEATRRWALALVESHPKLLVGAALERCDEAGALLHHHGTLSESGRDHEADALVAAWCAARWWYRRWPIDLFQSVADELKFPAGSAAYPWPEKVSG